MGHKLLLDVSPAGLQHSIEVDETGFYSVEHVPTVVENVILDECSKLRSLHQKKNGGFQLAAKVPILTHRQWKDEWRAKYKDTWTWPTFLSMKLNNRDNQNLRVGHKRSGSMKL